MGVRAECRHYIMKTVPSGEKIERCRLEANEVLPFSCPEHCVFFESRSTSSTGWQVVRPGEDNPR